MISGITGVLEEKGPDWVQVRIGGSVTLQISVPTSTVQNLGERGEEVHLHTRLFIRDDEAVLYGFSSAEALNMFQILCKVSGIGPRISLALLSTLGPGSLVTAVATGDLDTLSRVPGVGKKGAGRLVLELKGKLEKTFSEAPLMVGEDHGDVVAALMALGYSAAESRRMVSGAGSLDGVPLEEKIRRAFQQIAG